MGPGAGGGGLMGLLWCCFAVRYEGVSECEVVRDWAPGS